MHTYHWDKESDGVLTKTALIRKLESLGNHCNRYIYSPNTVFPEHDHQIDKIDAVKRA